MQMLRLKWKEHKVIILVPGTKILVPYLSPGYSTYISQWNNELENTCYI